MSSKEKKEFIDFLKKETERLINAINTAQENGSTGRTANQEQMRDAYQKFLNKLSGEIR
jgi:hypothetical protein